MCPVGSHRNDVYCGFVKMTIQMEAINCIKYLGKHSSTIYYHTILNAVW